MGAFFTDILSFQHETAVFDVNPHQLRFVYNTYRFTTLEEIKEFEPELVTFANIFNSKSDTNRVPISIRLMLSRSILTPSVCIFAAKSSCRRR